MNGILPELVLIVSASYVGAVGYGEVYRCKLEQPEVEVLIDNIFNITILANDKEKNDFLQHNLSPGKIEISLTMISNQEPYRLAPISGFVDNNKAAWEIKKMRPINLTGSDITDTRKKEEDK